MITGSIVTYHNSEDDIKKVIDSFLGFGLDSILFIVDNSSNDSLSSLSNNIRIRYIYNNENIGFGAAHNVAFKEAYKLGSSYHILLNPDIYFSSTIISVLIKKMNLDSTIGLIMPKIVYPNGQTQYLCKLLPTPKDLILRRFIPFKKIKEKHEVRYELRFFSYNKEVEIPVLSGCFMIIRTSVLKRVNGFDEQFFMYLEDVDLCRRIGKISKLIYFPEVKVTHNYEKGSYSNSKLLLFHIKSAIRYFNKWGWMFDKERIKINKKALQKLKYKG